jgi:hypothetical protein
VSDGIDCDDICDYRTSARYASHLLGVLSGHKRVPLPPAKMTALRCFIYSFLHIRFLC